MKTAVSFDGLRVKEACQIANVSTAKIYQWINEGRFGTWSVKQRGKERGLRFVDRRSFTAWLESQRAEIHYGPIREEVATA